MSYTPDPYDDTQPQGATVRAKDAAPEFRAIKTALKALKTAVTETLPNALTALTTSVGNLETAQSSLSIKVRQELTGSGNFTVPAGVTTLWVTARGGAKAEGTYHAVGGFGASFTYTQTRGINSIYRKKITVTPSQVIAYSVGLDEIITITNNGTSQRLAKTVSAGNTSFGALLFASAGSVEATVTDDRLLIGTPGVFPMDIATASPGAGTFSSPDGCGAFLTVEY